MFKPFFRGRLVTSAGGVVANQPIKAYLNDTQIAETLTTGSDGCFSFERNFDPTDQKVTYMLKVVYEGTGSTTATLNGTDLEGKPYTLCQTTQFNYKPSTNTTTVVVEPQATQVTVPTKTSEEMQQEAEQTGWFKVEPEFSWWFPWFRLHYKLSVDLPEGNPKLDYGWSPLPFGESSDANIPVMANIMNSATESDRPYELAEFFGLFAVPLIIQATTSYFLGRSLAAIGVAVALYGMFLAAYTLYSSIRADGNPKAWLDAFLGAAFMEMAAVFVPDGSGAVAIWHLLKEGGRAAWKVIQDPLQALHACKLNFFAITGAIFALMDFVVMVFYLSMYLNLVLR